MGNDETKRKHSEDNKEERAAFLALASTLLSCGPIAIAETKEDKERRRVE